MSAVKENLPAAAAELIAAVLPGITNGDLVMLERMAYSALAATRHRLSHDAMTAKEREFLQAKEAIQVRGHVFLQRLRRATP